MAEEVKVKLQLIDELTKELNALTKKANANFKKIDGGAKKSGKGLNDLKSGFVSLKTVGIGAAAILGGKLVQSFVRAGSEMEDLTTQFKVLLGSTTDAKKRMEELSKFAQTTPFQLKDVANASRTLETLTQGALSTGDGLRLVGDAAAATGADFQNLSIHVGRAYDGLQSNRPVGESMMRLQELGLVTGDTRTKIEELQKAGKGKEAWQVLQDQLKKTEGGMKELSGTVTGLTSTFKDQLSAAMRQMLEGGIWDGTKSGMQGLVDSMNEMLETGLFVRVGQGIKAVALSIKAAFDLMVTGVNTALFAIIKSWDLTISGITKGLKIINEKFDILVPDKMITALESASSVTSDWSHTVGVNLVDGFENIDGTLKSIKGSFSDIKDVQEHIDITKPKGNGGGTGGGVQAKNAKEIADTVLGITREFMQIGASDRDKELAEIKTWYDEKYEIIKGNIVAESELEILADVKRQEVKDKYRAEELEKQKEFNRKKIEQEKYVSEFIQQQAIQTHSALWRIQEIGVKKLIKSENDRKNVLAAMAFVEHIAAGAIAAREIWKSDSVQKPYQAIAMTAAMGVQSTASGIAAAAAIKSKGFEHGGIIPGDNYGRDGHIARVEAGEMIINRSDQARLWNFISSGGTTGASISMGDVIINGNADATTVDALQRTREEQLDQLKDMMKELQYTGQI